MTGNGYYLQSRQQFSNRPLNFIIRFSLTTLGVVTNIFQVSRNASTSAGYCNIQMTADGNLRIRSRNHLGGNTDFIHNFGGAQLNTLYTIVVVANIAYFQGVLLRPITDVNDGGSGIQPVFLGCDNSNVASQLIFHEFVLLNDIGDPFFSPGVANALTHGQLGTIHLGRLSSILRASQVSTHYIFDKQNWLKWNRSFADRHLGLSPIWIVGLQYHNHQILEHLFSTVVVGQSTSGYMIPIASNTLMKDRWYPESRQTNMLNLNLTGRLSLYDDTSVFPILLNVTPTFSTGLRLTGNKMGGTASSTDVAISNVTMSGLRNIYIDSQTPVGTHDLTWNQDGNILDFNASNGKYSKLKLQPIPTVPSIVVDNFTVSNNSLSQNISDLYDPTKVLIKNFTAQNPGTGLIGTIVYSNNATRYQLENSGVTGNIPRPPDSFTGQLILSSNPGLNQVPTDFNNISGFICNSSKIYGNIIANKATDMNVGSISANSNAPAGQDFLDYDFSNSTVNWGGYLFGSGKVRNFIFPTATNLSCINLSLNSNPNLTFPNGWPTTFVITGTLNLSTSNGSAVSTMVFPIGTSIRSQETFFNNSGMLTATSTLR